MSDGDAVLKLGMGFQEKQSGTKNLYSQTNSHPKSEDFKKINHGRVDITKPCPVKKILSHL